MKTKEKFIKIVIRILDNYILEATKEEDFTGLNSYWSDYYHEEDYFNEEEYKTIFIKIPFKLGIEILKQGTSNQYFSDGYQAYDSVSQYINL